MSNLNPAHISVAREFTNEPGFRFRQDGPFSGEEFLESLLAPRFEAAQKMGTKLVIDLNGVSGYATSFLESAFGGLAGIYGADTVLAGLEFKCDEEPSLDYEIRRYIKESVPVPQPA